VLEELVKGNVVNVVKVPEAVAEPARVALQRMLDITAAPVRD
jgi:quinolinate synthase